jgi:glycosyltransferase involved in cell wall biosynthesis
MKENNMPSKHYIIITPAKNEEESLPGLIQSVVKQTITPKLWVIVDDGSTDKTPEIIEEAKKEYDWIQTIHLKESIRDLGIHYSQICTVGFDFAVEYCKKQGIEYDYLGLIDADIILEETYFERLIKEFENKSKLGIASGEVWNIVGEEKIRSKQRSDLPCGGARLWRRQCFEETDGYLLTYAPDSVSNVKAKLKGWDTRSFEEIKVTSTRALASAEGYWKEFKGFGIYGYYVGFNLLYAVFKGIRYSFEKPYYIGLAYLFGYFSCLISRKKRIEDKEIRYYYQHIRPREINRYHFGILKNMFKRAKDSISNHSLTKDKK